MISVCINGTERDDIIPIAGGSVSMTAAHVASSGITVQVPTGSAEPQECDYIQLIDRSKNLLNPAAGALTGVGSAAATQVLDGDFTIQSNWTSNAVTVSISDNQATLSATGTDSDAHYFRTTTGFVSAMATGHRYYIYTVVQVVSGEYILQFMYQDANGYYMQAASAMIPAGYSGPVGFIADVPPDAQSSYRYIHTLMDTSGASAFLAESIVSKCEIIDMGTASSNPFYNMTADQMSTMVQKKEYWEGPSQLGGVDCTVAQDGAITLDGRMVAVPNMIEIVPTLQINTAANSNPLFTMANGQKYTISKTVLRGSVSGSASLSAFDTDGNAIANKVFDIFLASLPFTLTAGAVNAGGASTSSSVGMLRLAPSLGSVWSAYTFRLQLEPSSTQTAWVPYYRYTTYAGVIRAADQHDMGIAADLPIKLFNLTISGNADMMAGIFCDLMFPAGATVQQVLMGNHSGDSWFDSSLGEFNGLRIRLEAEGISIGTVDTFAGSMLSDTAYLWGSYVNDVLDTLASAAGAWWEITPDKAFNMRFSSYHPAAPIFLTPDAAAYEMEPSRDSYTMYSAVRVIGGKGRGAYKSYHPSHGGYGLDPTNISSYTDTTIILEYPVHSNLGVLMYWGNTQDISTYDIRIGWSGIDDNNPNVDMLATYGSAEIKAANGFMLSSKWGDPAQYEYSQLAAQYYPLFPIMARLIDTDLSAQIQSQRGGNGIVEYELKDDSISDFQVAMVAGANFLAENARPAVSIKFKTQQAGFRPGQRMSSCNIPYYGIAGDYDVGAVTATIISSGAESEVAWEYEIEASNIQYRDPLKSVFYTATKATFKLGDDTPVGDGRFINNEVDIQTSITARAIDPSTCSAFESQGWTCAAFEANGWTCDQFEHLLKEWNYLGHFLTDAARADLIQLLNGGTAAASLDTRTIYFDYVAELAPFNRVYAVPMIGSPIISGSQAIMSYIIDAGTVFDYPITVLKCGPSPSSRENMDIPVSIDKSVTSPLGDYTLTITKKDVIL